MRFFLVTVSVLMLAGQPGAETYSWVDDTGTFNFTEDLSQVPKKYRKNVNRRGDIEKQDAAADTESDASPVNASPEKDTQAAPGQVEESREKPVVQPGGDVQLYGGKTHDAWRKELNAHESELTRLDQQLEQIRKEIENPAGISRERKSELITEYENIRVDYIQKSKIYSELIESARKAGLLIEIKK